MQASKRDYYKILGLRRNAGKKEITKAYRKLAQKWHPDNFQDETEKKAAEKKFMDIAAAKEVLTDDGMHDLFTPVNLAVQPSTLVLHHNFFYPPWPSSGISSCVRTD